MLPTVRFKIDLVLEKENGMQGKWVHGNFQTERALVTLSDGNTK